MTKKKTRTKITKKRHARRGTTGKPRASRTASKARGEQTTDDPSLRCGTTVPESPVVSPRADDSSSSSSVVLSPKHQRFVAEYLIDLNAAAAARRAGYAAKNSDVEGARLLGAAGIAEAVTAGRTAQLAAAGVTKARLLLELGRLALVNLRDYWNADGTAKLPHELTEDQGACLAGFEVAKKNLTAGDGYVDTIHKFKLWNKREAIELYMKHYGMLTEKIEIKSSTADARIALLLAARKRTA